MPESPLGEPLPGWQPLPRPGGTVLEGTTVRAEPLEPHAHAAGLFGASHAPAADPRLWDYLPYKPFADEGRFAGWLGTLAGPSEPLFLALIDSATQSPFGMASFLSVEPEHGSIEIGHIWIGGAHQRTRQATEASTCSPATRSTISASGGWSGSATRSTPARAHPSRLG